MLDSGSQTAVLFKTISRLSHGYDILEQDNDFLMRIAHSDLKLRITFGNHNYLFYFTVFLRTVSAKIILFLSLEIVENSNTV